MSRGEKLTWVAAYVAMAVLSSPLAIWMFKAWWFCVEQALHWDPAASLMPS